jgi:hypothetical protein
MIFNRFNYCVQNAQKLTYDRSSIYNFKNFRRVIPPDFRYKRKGREGKGRQDAREEREGRGKVETNGTCSAIDSST